eukprot:Hpha_TRINITY_DN15607_c0_g11::TRINITY_DN15607_c0_g11_i1::g.99564::m.99564
MPRMWAPLGWLLGKRGDEQGGAGSLGAAGAGGEVQEGELFAEEDDEEGIPPPLRGLSLSEDDGLLSLRQELRNHLNEALVEAAQSIVQSRTLRIAVATFNVGEKMPRNLSGEARKWLTAEMFERADIIAVGLQEVDMSAQNLVLERECAKAELWQDILTAQLADLASDASTEGYAKLACISGGGLLLAVFCKEVHSVRVANLKQVKVRTGKGGLINKGAIALRFTLYGRRFLFVNAHLDAHTEAVLRRNKHYDKILSELDQLELGRDFDDPCDLIWPQAPLYCPTEMESYPEVVQAATSSGGDGDESSGPGSGTASPTRRRSASVNMSSSHKRRPTADATSPPRDDEDSSPVRIQSHLGLPHPESTSTLDERDEPDDQPLLDRYDYVFWFGDLNYRLTGIPNERVREMVAKGLLAELLRFDQLNYARYSDCAFTGFEEHSIAFPPTYKFDEGTNTYDSSRKRRAPSWTDRVLWRCNPKTSFPPTPTASNPISLPPRAEHTPPEDPHSVAFSMQSCIQIAQTPAPKFGGIAAQTYKSCRWDSTYTSVGGHSAGWAAGHSAGFSGHSVHTPGAHNSPPNNNSPPGPGQDDDAGIPVCGAGPRGMARESSNGPMSPDRSRHMPHHRHLDQVPQYYSQPFEEDIPVGGAGVSTVSVYVLAAPEPLANKVQLRSGVLTMGMLESVISEVCGISFGLLQGGAKQRCLLLGATPLCEAAQQVGVFASEKEVKEPFYGTIIFAGTLLRIAERDVTGRWEAKLRMEPASEKTLGIRWESSTSFDCVRAAEVEAGKAGHRTGIREDMRLLEVDSTPVRSLSDMRREFERLRARGGGLLRIGLPSPRNKKHGRLSEDNNSGESLLPIDLSYRTALPAASSPPDASPQHLAAWTSSASVLDFRRCSIVPALQEIPSSPPMAIDRSSFAAKTAGSGGAREDEFQPKVDVNAVRSLRYSAYEVLLSDHRPVACAFEIACVNIDDARAAQIIETAVASPPVRRILDSMGL